MQFIGDHLMDVFAPSEPVPHHADSAFTAALAMHEAQSEVNDEWISQGMDAFGLGIGLSTGQVAAALLGSEERLEYTVVGDIVNLSQRLQQWAEAGETILSKPTWEAVAAKPDADVLAPTTVKGRGSPVQAYRFPRRSS